jgi:hypothetical protein
VQWPLLFGQRKRHGLSVGWVWFLGVVTLLTSQALPIRARLHGGGRYDGLGRQEQPISFMLCGHKKNRATLESN